MPSKVYLQSPPDGDFRAMPALGDGLAIVKWVTSFPGNPGRGLPVVMGTILVNNATDGHPMAMIDARAVTALRTGASRQSPPRLSRATAPPRSASSAAGCTARGRRDAWRPQGTGRASASTSDEAALRLAGELGWKAGSVRRRAGVRRRDLHHSRAHPAGHRGPTTCAGTHINMLGADGPGKSEAEAGAVRRCELFCDEWEQASHGGELTGAVAAGLVAHEGDRHRRGAARARHRARLGREATLFDSTGLAIQDLALCHALMEAHEAGVAGGLHRLALSALALAVAAAVLLLAPGGLPGCQPCGPTAEPRRPTPRRLPHVRGGYVRGFAIGYVAECDDGETLRGTFRFRPARVSQRRFTVKGPSSGTLPDGRTTASKLRLSGVFAGGRARGAFSYRHPDGAAGWGRSGHLPQRTGHVEGVPLANQHRGAGGTRGYRSITSLTCMRMQPWEARLPIDHDSEVPCMPTLPVTPSQRALSGLSGAPPGTVRPA